MKTLTLEAEYDCDFALFGLAAGTREHTLAWSLNRNLHVRLVRQPDFVLKGLIKPFVDVNKLTTTVSNHKSKLIEWAQRNGKEVRYELSGEPRPGGVMEFTATVFLSGEVIATGMGLNKKQAEQLAAERALSALGV